MDRRAFEQNAVDYLLKPFSRKRFGEAINKLTERLSVVPKMEPDLEKIKKHLEQSEERLHRVVIKKTEKIHVISTDDINYFEAQDDYVDIHCTKGKWLKQKTMKYFENALNEAQFVRIHRKYILNIEMISKLDKLGKETYMVLLKSGENLPVSAGGYQKLKLQLGI